MPMCPKITELADTELRTRFTHLNFLLHAPRPLLGDEH
jgi:hypothetical protein